MPEVGIITNAQISDLRNNPALIAELALLEHETGTVHNHPAVYRKVFGPEINAENVTIPWIGLGGRNPLEQIADGEDFARSSIETDLATISAGRFGRKYGATDLVRATDSQRIFRTDVMAMEAVAAKNQAALAQIAALGGNFTGTAGTPGSVLTVPQYQGAIYTLDARNVVGVKLAALAGIQWKHITDYVTANAGGAFQFSPAAQRVIEMTGGGAKGNFLGADVFVHSRAPSKNSGVDVGGCIFGFGGIVLGEWSYVDDGDPNQALLSPATVNGQVVYTLSVERDRDPGAGTTDWVLQCLMGASIGRDNCGISLITRAT